KNLQEYEFEVTKDPTRTHPDLPQRVVEFDSVDGESKQESLSPPSESFPYSYWYQLSLLTSLTRVHYTYTNIASLNNRRRFQGLQYVCLPPTLRRSRRHRHMSHTISHGILLRQVLFDNSHI
ncbi:hypothetical protein JOM56_006756, partial [Amanita muscaria]